MSNANYTIDGETWHDQKPTHAPLTRKQELYRAADALDKRRCITVDEDPLLADQMWGAYMLVYGEAEKPTGELASVLSAYCYEVSGRDPELVAEIQAAIEIADYYTGETTCPHDKPFISPRGEGVDLEIVYICQRCERIIAVE